MFNGRTVSIITTLKERIESIMVAAAFAEANKHDTALEMLPQRPDKRLRQRPQYQHALRKDSWPVLIA